VKKAPTTGHVEKEKGRVKTASDKKKPGKMILQLVVGGEERKKKHRDPLQTGGKKW